MHDIARYDINEHGELPLSYGRYVRWEDVEPLLEQISQLEEDLASAESPCCSFDAGYQEGKLEGIQDVVRMGLRSAVERIQVELIKY